MTAFLFPGQGSQMPEMREEVAELRADLLALVDDLVGEDPFARVEESTRFAQPAILCCALARWSALGAAPTWLLGHSLGELGALAAGGAMDERTALELVVIRGRLMAEASAPGTGMLAVLRGSVEEVEDLARTHGVSVANDNAPGQVVLSGPLTRLDAAARDARRAGLRTMRLPVAGAFHSPLMEPALPAWREALDAAELRVPRTPVVSCMTAALIDDPAAALAAGLTQRVRFREALLFLGEQGVEDFVDVGPGRILEGMVKRTVPAHA